jgi:hypothetical protein
MAKNAYKNPSYLDESVRATQKALKDPYAGRQTGPRAKDQTGNQDPQSRAAKVGVGDIPVNSWLRGGGKGGEGNPNFNPSRTSSRDPATEGSGGRQKSSGK